MKSVLAAELAILFKFQSVRIILLVLLCVVVSLLALCADKGYFDSCFISHDFGTSHFRFLFDCLAVCVPPSEKVVTFCAQDTKKKPFFRGKEIIPHFTWLVKGFDKIFSSIFIYIGKKIVLAIYRDLKKNY